MFYPYKNEENPAHSSLLHIFQDPTPVFLLVGVRRFNACLFYLQVSTSILHILMVIGLIFACSVAIWEEIDPLKKESGRYG